MLTSVPQWLKTEVGKHCHTFKPQVDRFHAECKSRYATTNQKCHPSKYNTRLCCHSDKNIYRLQLAITVYICWNLVLDKTSTVIK